MERIETTETIIKDGDFTLEKDIATFDHFMTDEECDFYISVIETSKGFMKTRQESDNAPPTMKTDLGFWMPMQHIPYDENLPTDYQNFIERFWDVAIEKYCSHYGSLLDGGYLSMHGIKFQKTATTEGYHVWHYENSTAKNTTRSLAWILYLNDDFEGGETEFLYKSLRLKPKKGTLVVFPGGFTHTHRGNPPLTGTKYVITSFVQLAEYDSEIK
jgi:hypothetical protein